MSRSRTRKSSARRTPRILPQGVLKMSGAGYGFVQTSEGEFFIPASKTADAFDGDVVEVARIRDGEREGGFEDRLRGCVVRVVGRAHETVVGRYEIAEPFGVVVPEDPRIKHDIFTLRSDAPHVKDGDIVRVRMTSFPSRREPAQGVVEEVLGHEGQPGADVELIIARHKLATSFSATSLAEVEGADVDADAAFNSGRYVDLRSELAFTVDPDDAKDFDDAVSAACVWLDGPATLRSAHRALAVKKEGSSEPGIACAADDASSAAGALFFILGVHIADVSHYVPWNSQVDFEARERATSVYLVDRVLPMLPEALSNDVCSLRPHEERRAMSVEMLIDEKGFVRDARITPSVIKSKARLTYGTVQVSIDALQAGDFQAAVAALRPMAGAFAEDIAQSIGVLHEIAQALHANRVRRGGMDFESEEAKVRLNDEGVPVSVAIRRKTDATALVEEAMIAANEAVARYLCDAGIPSIFRVHEPPSSGDLTELVPILQEFGYDRHVSLANFKAGDPFAIQQVLSFARGRSEEFLVSSLVVRAMKRAVYADSCEGHFGLASTAYTHFTSPIRRYPDLMVHRMLKVALFGRTGETSGLESALARIADHASTAERTAEEAARESQELKLFELLEQRIGDEVDGMISGVMAQGFFVRLADTCEGFVSLRDAGEYFVLDAARRVLFGSDSGVVYRLGTKVRVRISSVYPYARRADFDLVRRIGPRLVARK